MLTGKMLQKATEELHEELLKVTRKVIVLHDGLDTLEVHMEPQFKAYVPKKWNGFRVMFEEWSGNEVTYNLDELIA